METRIGISGWRYEPWRNTFYPPKMPQKKELEFASRMVNAIELNGTFYSLQRGSSFKNWYASTPDDFKFTVKGPRYITHIRRLKDCEEPLANFFGCGVLHFKEKLGPFLWQFPELFLFHEELFENFFKQLPRTFAEAAKLGKKADRVEPDFPKDFPKTKIRHAVEVRHDSFMNPDFIALLRKHDIALVFADTAGNWPYMEDLTSDFVYLRLHGEADLYASGYPDESLDWWAERIKKWEHGREAVDPQTISGEKPAKLKSRDAYVFFDNDVKVHAPFNAQGLLSRLTKFQPRNASEWKTWL